MGVLEEEKRRPAATGRRKSRVGALRKGYHMKRFSYKAAWPLYLLALIIGMGMAL